MTNHKKNKIIIIGTRDWIIKRFFINQIQYLIKNGFEVIIICKITQTQNLKSVKNIRLLDIDISRSGISINTLFFESLKIYRLISTLKPNYVLSCGIKSIFLSSLSFFKTKIKFINCIIGLGYFFNQKKSLSNLFATFYFRNISKFKNAYFIVETIYMKKTICKKFLINKKKVFIQGGVGIDTSKFKFNKTTYKKNDKIKFLIVSRLLKDKGINEIYYSLKNLPKDIQKKVEFTIIGDFDENNPNKIDSNIFNFFAKNKNLVKLIPTTTKVHFYLNKCHILIHPSHHEGLSVICQEALCTGRGIIASNIPGCREIVINKFNGFLIQPKNELKLLEKIIYLINNSEYINIFSINSRKIIYKFSKEEINKKFNQSFKKIIQDI